MIAVLAALVLGADSYAERRFNGWEGPKPQTPCLCRHRGGKAQVGETICAIRSGQMVTLRCDKVLNNTNWTEIARGCDVG